MSSRNQIDSVIDDDDEFCPLCIEEFDLSDKNFKPCPCGYQICQFCYNNIKTHSEEGRCPNCRRVYDESTIQYKVPDVDEFKADLALKHRKAAAAKKKEAEKREIEASSRKNLAGVRVVQKNLVYVIGLNPTIRDEGQLLQTLRGPEYFGQYGEIDKIVVSKAKPGGNPNQGIGVYVTFSRKADAASCIAAVDGSTNGDRLLRAQYGTTKYCSSFLRNEQCNNRNCTFLHETGDDNESYSRQDLSSMNTVQRPHYTNGATTAGSRSFTQPPQSQPMRRQGSKDEGAKPLPDGPALPSSASWANKDAPINRARRLSAGSRSSPSPKPANVPLAKSEELKKNFPTAQESRRSTPAPAPAPVSTPAPAPAPAPAAAPTPAPSQGLPPAKPATIPTPVKDSLLESLLNAVNSPGFRFVFSTDGLSDDDLKYIENGPSLIDPYGGAKRRAMREKVEQERAKQEAETQSLLQSAAADDENHESGSLQLGGEPDDVHPSRSTVSRNRDTHGAIQPPSQQTTNANSLVGSPVSISHQFHNLNMNNRSLTPLQQQQLMLLKSGTGQQGGLVDSLNPAFDQASQSRSGLFQGGISQAGTSNTRLFGQQNLMQTGNPGQVAAPAPQQGQFYTSSVQGPPPGLKTAGTPPISGGGMFAQGHGFTSNTNLGLGSNAGKQEANPDLMRELLRGRGVSAGTGGLQGHESTKREFSLPFIQQHHTPPPLTPATGLLSAFYGSQNGALADFGPQKQKKKGKKHRHANTSSGGGGVVDLADPSILQARMHQVGVGSTGQVLYGSQGQVDDEEFPPLNTGTKSKLEHAFRPTLTQESREHSRAGTPSLPPGLPLPHGHPPAAFFSDKKSSESPEFPYSLPTHGPPGLPASGRGTPLQKSLDTVSGRQTPTVPHVSDENAQVEKTRNFGDISLGSPKARSARKPNATAPTDQPVSNKPTVTKGSQNKKPKPIKLDLSMPLEEVPAASPVKESPASSNAIPANLAQSNVAANSRPGTPLTGTSRNSDSSGPRQPRVLRVVDTPKTETPPPPSAVPSLSSVVQAKIRSRRPSISSADRPDTPGDVGSDFEFTSASVSRANSPPPSKIGSAPVRAMTKNQAKKERRMKAKQAEEAIKEEVATAIPEEPVQAPIIGRKRKTKKPPTTSEQATSTSTREPSDAENVPTPKAETKADVGTQKPKSSPEKVPDVSKPALDAEVAEPSTDEPWRANNTIAQLIEDAKATGTSIKDLFLERTAPLHVLLAQMQSKGDIDLNNHPLFNPPPLNQRTDMKCEAEDYEFFKLPLYISEENKKVLLSGQPLRINHGVDNLKVRCMITPMGRVLRHLSDEEEDRYLELESHVDAGTWNEYPSTNVPGLDVTNMNGGLDALFLTPGRFGIALSEPPSPRMSLAAGGAVVSAEDQFALDPPSESGATMGETDHPHKLPESARYPPIIPEMDNVFGMSNKELRAFIEQSQRELEGSRKEFDAIDKKLAALVKRNKKLAQQALSSVVEVGK